MDLSKWNIFIFNLNQTEILDRLADYYIEGLTNLDEDANLKIFYSASILAQTYFIDEPKEKLNKTKKNKKNKKKALKNQKFDEDSWISYKKEMFLRVDSLIDKDLGYCTSVGIGELNFLYYQRNFSTMMDTEFNLVIFSLIYSLNYKKINYFKCSNSVLSLFVS
ncbi:unnamed protein product [Meloidogyne enterolobii]|uniref:Uncharacterized protein n=1 Tax=Meloidogyne enterolobii TaxID=390850 RepID=A0ACB0ZYN1_MELEN